MTALAGAGYNGPETRQDGDVTEPTGTPCFCPCHTSDDIVHVQACCCRHRFKRGTCTQCDRKKLEAAKAAAPAAAAPEAAASEKRSPRPKT